MKFFTIFSVFFLSSHSFADNSNYSAPAPIVKGFRNSYYQCGAFFVGNNEKGAMGDQIFAVDENEATLEFLKKHKVTNETSSDGKEVMVMYYAANRRVVITKLSCDKIAR